MATTMAAVASPVVPVAQVAKELHDLSQPLTCLMCQLELGKMMGDADSLGAAVEGALLECRRLFDGFAAMRTRLVGQTSKEDAA